MTREELYNLVWAEPVTKVAKRFGVSDVALRKTCVRHNIPTPPLGYWAKLAHGKRVKQTSLPISGEGGRDISLTLKVPEDVPAIVSEALSVAAKREQSLGPILCFEKRPATVHPVTLATEGELKGADVNDEGFIHVDSRESIAVSVGVKSVTRVVLILKSFMRSCSSRGWNIKSAESGIRVAADNVRFAIRVYETRSKRAHVPTASDIRRQAEYDDNSKRMPSLYPPRKVTPTWDHHPSGRLCFEISDPSRYSWNAEDIVGRWYERKNRRIESCFGDAFIAMAGAAAKNKLRDAERKERERIRAEKEEQRRREAEERAREKREAEYFLKKAEQLKELESLKALSRHIKPENCAGPAPPVERLLSKLDNLINQLSEELSPDAISRGLAEKSHVERVGT